MFLKNIYTATKKHDLYEADLNKKKSPIHSLRPALPTKTKIEQQKEGPIRKVRYNVPRGELFFSQFSLQFIK